MNKFYVAFKGLLIAWRDYNIKIQFFLAIGTVFLGLILKITVLEWMFVVFAIGFVIVSEMFNTCIEKICDFMKVDYDEKIKEIKDLSSAAVLLSCITAAVIAFFILIT